MKIVLKHPPVPVTELKPGPLANHFPVPQTAGDLSVVLNVTAYSVREYPGQSTAVSSGYAGKDLGYMILTGDVVETVPANVAVKYFLIHFLPDGTDFPLGGYSPGELAVEICMNWCQFEPLLKILKTADSVQAIYTYTAPTSTAPAVGWADVEGQFTRK